MCPTCVSDVGRSCSSLLAFSQYRKQLLLVPDLINDLLMASLQPINEGYSVLWILLCKISAILKGSQGGMTTLCCYFSHSHFEVHSDEQNQLHLVLGVHLELFLCLEQTNHGFDGLFDSRRGEEGLIDQLLLELHRQ